MSDSDSKELSIKLPGEWALQKAFGPVLGEIGDDLKRLYAVGRDRILANAYEKIEDVDDGRQANLRVTRDVMWNGAFSDSEVCAEYFGGILASSRSRDGEDDSAVHFIDVIKSLSSKQLQLHYHIYNSFNKILVASKTKPNVGQSTELSQRSVWMYALELQGVYHIDIDRDTNILWRQGIVSEYRSDTENIANIPVSYLMVRPTTFGILLYSAVHNRLPEWRRFPSLDYGNFDSIENLMVFGDSKDSLAGQLSGQLGSILERIKAKADIELEEVD